MKRRSAWFGVLCLAVSACGSKPAPSSPPVDEAAPSAPTRWVAVTSAQKTALLQAPARIVPAPESEALVSAPLTARVVRIRVQLGHRVSKGATVVDVVMPGLLEAAGEAVGAGARVEAWSKRRTQLKSLESEGLARASDLVEAETNLAEAKASLERARATLQGAGFSVKEAKALLDGGGVAALKAPIAGIVTELDVKVGETRPEASPLARIAGAGVPGVEARFIQPPPEGATFLFVSPDGSSLAARLVSWSPRADPRDGSFPAWFALEGGRAPPAGTPGVLKVEPSGESGLVSAPSTAVRLVGGRTIVIVRAGGDGRPVEVSVVAQSGAEAVLRSRDPGTLVEGNEVALDAAAWALPAGESP